MKAGVDGVSLDGCGEAAVAPAVIVDGAEDVDDPAEPGRADGVAFGESPPGVEIVEAFFEVPDSGRW